MGRITFYSIIIILTNNLQMLHCFYFHIGMKLLFKYKIAGIDLGIGSFGVFSIKDLSLLF